MWLMVLEAGQEWGMAPWAVEEQATALWWERWRVWREEKGRFEARPSTGSGAGGARGGAAGEIEGL